MSAFKCPYKPTKTCDTYLQLSLVDEKIQILGSTSFGGVMQQIQGQRELGFTYQPTDLMPIFSFPLVSVFTIA